MGRTLFTLGMDYGYTIIYGVLRKEENVQWRKMKSLKQQSGN